MAEKRRVNRIARRRRFIREIGKMDLTLLFIILFLLAFGLVMLYSASYYEASMNAVSNYDAAYYLKRQGLWMLVGLAGMVVVSLIPYRLYRRFHLPEIFFWISVLLVILCIFSSESHGAQRWLHIGPMSLQPAEIVKITTIILVAKDICILGTGLSIFRYTVRAMFQPAIAVILIFAITNNLSSAIIVMLIAAGMLFVARRDYKFFIGVAMSVLAVAGAIIWAIVYQASQGVALGNFRFQRILTWLDPEAASGDSGYQTLQALYAIGSGGWFGRGLGNSMQKLDYIPEVQNDMIFSVVCEELGIFGAAAIIIMFMLLCWRLMVIADNAPDAYGGLLVTGVFCHIAVQVALNLAVVTNTFPNTGITLPFISYGGSSLVFTLAEMGIVFNVMRNVED